MSSGKMFLQGWPVTAVKRSAMVAALLLVTGAACAQAAPLKLADETRGATAAAAPNSVPAVAPVPTMEVLRDGMAAPAAQPAAAGGAQAESKVKDDLFAGTEVFAKGASDINEITMDPDTLDLVGGNNSKRAHSMVLNVVRTYSYDKPGMYRMEDVEAFRNKLNTGDWHCSVHTRDLKTGESTDICAKRRTDGLIEQAIITVEPKELTFIHTIRKPREDRKSGDSSSMVLPDLEGAMAIMNPEMDARLAALGPKMEALGPLLAARMAVIGPELDAKMAVMQAKMAAAGARLQAPAAPTAPAAPAPPTEPVK